MNEKHFLLSVIRLNLIVGFLFFSTFSIAQKNIDKTKYLNSYGINKDSIQELLFKNKQSFNSFVSIFEEK